MTQASDIGATPNQSRTLYRGAINNCFQAVVTRHEGPTAPSTTYSNMEWWDTTSGSVKLRNPTNTAWASVGIIGPPFQWGYDTLVQTSGVLESAVLSGASVQLTDIPVGTIAFDLTLVAVQANAAFNVSLKLGTSAGIVVSGYASIAEEIGASYNTWTDQIVLSLGMPSTASLIGLIRGVRTVTNRWTLQGMTSNILFGGNNTLVAGTVILPGELDRLSLSCSGGTFSNGIYQVRWYR